MYDLVLNNPQGLICSTTKNDFHFTNNLSYDRKLRYIFNEKATSTLQRDQKYKTTLKN